MMTEKLKTCPFCGGKGEIKFDIGDYRTGEYRGYYVMCGNSDINCLAGWISGGCFATKEEAIEAWNTRAKQND